MRRLLFNVIFVVALGIAWLSWAIAGLIPESWWDR